MRCKSIFLLIFFLSTQFLQAQVSAGQFLVNGEFSFFNNNSAIDRTVSSRTVAGILVPGYNYTLDQYSSNLTFTPRVHYFINQKWSVGLSFTLRKLLARRTVDEFQLEEQSEYVAFSVPLKTQSLVSSYSPKMEIARHWQLNKRFAINLTGVLNWRWSSTEVINILSLSLPVKVEELNGSEVSEDGLTIKPNDGSESSETTKEQYWSVQVFPQLRFAITPRLGLTANMGGLTLSQQVKDDAEDFVRSAPNWSIQVNPGTWSLGAYLLIGSGRVTE
ncbi:MAG: hypothetical protein AB8F74_08765 [Saprospiraceae bacterium]